MAPQSDKTEADIVKKSNVNEFNDGRERPIYPWKRSVTDWFKQAFFSNYSNEAVEKELLSILPFYPESDGTREAKVINTPLGDGNFVHEFFIENKEKPADPTQIKDLVLVHGYAASLGLFIDNFDDLSRIPGIKIHAIDLLGFGFSSRPKFPDFPSKTKEDIYKIEDWFIDSFETWRKARNLNKFVLVGHSFGGYLSCAYALKYNRNKENNPIDKMVLVSPVGVERSDKSLLKNMFTDSSIETTKSIEDKQNIELDLSSEISQSQQQIMNNTAKNPEPKISQNVTEPSRKRQFFNYLWEKNYSPFMIPRNAGPFKSKLFAAWSTHRFAHVYYQDPEKFYAIHNYIYRIFNGTGSGEYAITRVLAPGALAKLPLIDRCPKIFAEQNIPTLLMYGDKDWMNDAAGLEMAKEINKYAGTRLAEWTLLPKSGHHLYLDNPKAFASKLFKFLNFY